MFGEKENRPLPIILCPFLADRASEPLLDSHKAAALLGVHPRTLQRMVHRGEIAVCM